MHILTATQYHEPTLAFVLSVTGRIEFPVTMSTAVTSGSSYHGTLTNCTLSGNTDSVPSAKSHGYRLGVTLPSDTQ